MENSPQTKKRVFVKTFGCQMNEYDTEKMLMLLSENYDRVESADTADLVIVNTCSVREKGEHKLYGLLGRLRDLKEKRPDLVIGVGGCVAQQEGQNIIKRNQAVDFVVGTHNISLVPSLVKESLLSRQKQVAVDYTEEWEELPDQFDAMPEKSKIVPSAFNSSVRALVAIQRGCDKKCAFCVVPTTRGPQVSRTEDEILKEIKLKVRMGAREVLLLGQTVNSYGVDLKQRKKFSDLVRKIADIENVSRIRFISPHPAEIKHDFIRLYNEVPQLCPQIHMPLQSGSNRILKAMNRNYKKERYLEVIEQLRDVRSDIAISTDIIVGFPTESDAEFEETLEIMELVKFHMSFSFKYSIRPNTKANLQYQPADEVPEPVKTSRLTKLQKIQENHALSFNQSYLGENVEILVESKTDDISSKQISALRGRTLQNVFAQIELDKKIVDINNVVGKLVIGRVDQATPHGLKLVAETASGLVVNQ